MDFPQQYFCFFYSHLFIGGKHNCVHAKSTYKVGKTTLFSTSEKRKGQIWQERKFSLPFRFHGTRHLHLLIENIRA